MRTERKALALMLSTVLLFPVSDAIAKFLAVRVPVLEIVWGRLFFQSLVVGLLAFGAGAGRRLRSRRPGLQAVRALLLLANIVSFITALTLMPMATAVTILFVSPIMVVALSAPLLAERVAPRRWLAVLLGFVGASVAVNPGLPDAYLGAALALGSALAAALFQIVTRPLVMVDPPVATLFYTSLGGAALAALALPFLWTALGPAEWGLLVFSGALGGVTNWLVLRAFSYATPAVLAPLSYAEILGAAFLGWLVFGEVPDPRLALGAVLIVAAAALSAWPDSGAEPRSGL